MRFKKGDFTCPHCGATPSYIVVDGKVLAPAEERLEHLQELDRHQADDDVLVEATVFRERVYLHLNRERILVE